MGKVSLKFFFQSNKHGVNQTCAHICFLFFNIFHRTKDNRIRHTVKNKIWAPLIVWI